MSRYEIDFLEQYTDEALLSELRRVAALLPEGKRLTKTSYENLTPRVASSTVRHRFGGWRIALEKAGLGLLYNGRIVSQKMREQPIKRMSNDALVAELRRVHVLSEKGWLTSDYFNAHSVTSEDAVRLRFGSFRKGLAAAGIPHAPYKQRRRTDEECFENLAALWTHYGRRPAYREMSLPPSTIQAKTYVARWGTWRKAVKAFVEWANSEPSGDLGPDPGSAISGSSRSPEIPRTGVDCREVRPGLRFKVFQRDHFRCVACGRSPATHLNVELHADHVVSVADDGKTTFENLQTLCQDCNLGKGRTSMR